MAVLAVLRILPALIVLAANGHSLPLLPSYRYAPPIGDAYGFHAAAREFIAVWLRLSIPMLAVALAIVVAASAGGGILWRGDRRPEAIAVASLALGVFISIAVRQMYPPGCGAVGWPIVWSLPLFPIRIVGALGYHSAYYLGIAVSVGCNIVTVVATALMARRLVPGRLALVAPSLLVAWPFLMRFVEGSNAVFGSWIDDAGLALYSEPLSTALVTAALSLVITRTDPSSRACAGGLLGFATAVRVSNITLVLVIVLWLLASERSRSALLCGVASLGGVSIAAAYWPLSYPTFRDQLPDVIFSIHYVVPTWRDTPVFDWKMLLILLPPSILGFLTMRRGHPQAWLLAAVVALTAAFYSPYYFTPLHPRFLFVALPALSVLAAAGFERIATILWTDSHHIATDIRAS